MLIRTCDLCGNRCNDSFYVFGLSVDKMAINWAGKKDSQYEICKDCRSLLAELIRVKIESRIKKAE